MENASKALIIAGAILISIVLIAVGVLVVNNMNEPVDEAIAQMSDQAKRIFNSKFEGFAGDKRLPGDARALISAIIASNASETQPHKVLVQSDLVTDIAGDKASADESKISPLYNKIVNGATYNIDVYYTDGVVDIISINKNPWDE